MYNNCMSDYIARPLAESILHARRKAVILEGARAVGKTMMAQRQLVGVGFSYETLADTNAYELAKTDLHGWLESLNLPVIIDEAQRIRDLPLAVKEIVDALPAGHTQFILTGSALINRGGLDGQDPLARRAQRFTMSPLTQREMHGVDTSLVDDLWDGEPDVSFDEPIARQKLYDLMAAGGFPEYSSQYAEYADWERERLVADDIRAVLGDTILPDEKLDAAIAENILRAKRDYGISYLFFTDSVFNIGPEYNVRLAETLIRRRTDIRWGAYFSPRGIDAEQMRLFRASGLTHIEFGTESFCDRTLEAYGKRFTFGDVERASRLALDEGVYYAHFLILGGYGDTRENVRETIENSRRMEYTVMFPYAGMRIYPHTRLAELAAKEGAIGRDDDLMAPSYYISRDFDLEEVRRAALATGKAWVFPDDPQSALADTLRLKRNKKGPLWEYLRKP